MKCRMGLAILAVLLSVPVWAQKGEAIAVVVNHGNPASTISLGALKQMFKGEKLSWGGGLSVRSFTRGPGNPEYAVMLKNLFGMNETEYKQFLMMKQLRGEVQGRVAELSSAQQVASSVKTTPGAVALVRVSEVTADMKVLKIDGKGPDEAGYPLH